MMEIMIERRPFSIYKRMDIDTIGILTYGGGRNENAEGNNC